MAVVLSVGVWSNICGKPSPLSEWKNQITKESKSKSLLFGQVLAGEYYMKTFLWNVVMPQDRVLICGLCNLGGYPSTVNDAS